MEGIRLYVLLGITIAFLVMSFMANDQISSHLYASLGIIAYATYPHHKGSSKQKQSK